MQLESSRRKCHLRPSVYIRHPSRPPSYREKKEKKRSNSGTNWLSNNSPSRWSRQFLCWLVYWCSSWHRLPTVGFLCRIVGRYTLFRLGADDIHVGYVLGRRNYVRRDGLCDVRKVSFVPWVVAIGRLGCGVGACRGDDDVWGKCGYFRHCGCFRHHWFRYLCWCAYSVHVFFRFDRPPPATVLIHYRRSSYFPCNKTQSFKTWMADVILIITKTIIHAWMRRPPKWPVVRLRPMLHIKTVNVRSDNDNLYFTMIKASLTHWRLRKGHEYYNFSQLVTSVAKNSVRYIILITIWTQLLAPRSSKGIVRSWICIKTFWSQKVQTAVSSLSYVGLGPLSWYTINQLSRNLKIYTNYRQNL